MENQIEYDINYYKEQHIDKLINLYVPNVLIQNKQLKALNLTTNEQEILIKVVKEITLVVLSRLDK